MRPSRPNRREMMFSSLGAAAGLAAFGGCASSDRRPSEVNEVHDCGLRIAICDWTLGEMTDQAGKRAVPVPTLGKTRSDK